jgi:hypothetical protein
VQKQFAKTVAAFAKTAVRGSEDSMQGDRAGFAPVVRGDDILITHNEEMFLLARAS